MKINSQWVFYFYSLIYLLSVKNTWCVCITLTAILTWHKKQNWKSKKQRACSIHFLPTKNYSIITYSLDNNFCCNYSIITNSLDNNFAANYSTIRYSLDNNFHCNYSINIFIEISTIQTGMFDNLLILLYILQKSLFADYQFFFSLMTVSHKSSITIIIWPSWPSWPKQSCWLHLIWIVSSVLTS